ncbi:anthranilate phosphoribosyltransferase [Pullulanibacillus camelliae]|uniref:Anthranilate phosphoribosyltransferase n=1 Tax=Pullulanibacillus camelliae TaxID=1707096 RepID=A0A8J2YGY3_9BACL|nr:anthranilate phosphoribosyltransferase [Pullulanibacillus camelliae]GGE38795.1 anthranilate phosphoribosyltransferase [Pullulanibacillus camelliae]
MTTDLHVKSNFKDGLSRLINGEHFNRQEAKGMMDAIMSGAATSSQISAFLSILRFRGETAEELTGFVESMRAHALRLEHDEDVLDTCGTGGDGLSTFNISTAVAILISSLGVKVAKHGNRAVSSKSGSADVLEILGIPVQSTADEAVASLKTKHMCFLFAPLYHASMRFASAPRKELGFRTIFNVLGPLVNPAQSQRQLLGVFDLDHAKKMAESLRALGTQRALVVTGDRGLDELAITGPSWALLVEKDTIQELTLSPEDFGLPLGRLEEIQVKTARESAELIQAIFDGKNRSTPAHIVLLNAGAALFVADRVATIKEGIALAQEAIDSGKALRQLERLKTVEKVERHA